MELPRVIQGGMGAAISTWQLARAVAHNGGLGVVSGTGVGLLLCHRLARGEHEALDALRAFPDQETIDEIYERYWREPGPAPSFPLPEMWRANPSKRRERLSVAGAFVEVTLAKQGHDRPIGINVLEKAALPNLATLYGAMLAGVDCVLIGAGIPLRVPGALDALARHEPAEYPLEVEGATRDDNFRVRFAPRETIEGIRELPPLAVPLFFPIVSSHVLAQALLKRADGPIDGFVVEERIAGGHNAPPRGKLQLDERGEPVYGPRDDVSLEKMRALGKPFWLAGGFGTPEGLSLALQLGATGVQVGTVYAYCAESGMAPALKRAVHERVRTGEAEVRSDTLASPTGFPFKVVQLDGTLSDPSLRAARERVCNIGILRRMYRRDDGEIGYRCPAEPADQFVRKGGGADEVEGRACLCNGLMSAAGLQRCQPGAASEPALVTAGEDLSGVEHLLATRGDDYDAADVTRWLLGGAPDAVRSRA
jgi:nitronate monooxygenase